MHRKNREEITYMTNNITFLSNTITLCAIVLMELQKFYGQNRVCHKSFPFLVLMVCKNVQEKSIISSSHYLIIFSVRITKFAYIRSWLLSETGPKMNSESLLGCVEIKCQLVHLLSFTSIINETAT